MDTYHQWMEVVISGSLGIIPVVNFSWDLILKEGQRACRLSVNLEMIEATEVAFAFEQITDY